MMPFGGGTGRVGRSRMRLDEMDCADIMMKAVQRKRSRSIARRESFSGTEDDLRKFRDAVEANDKESKVLAADLQKDIDEYAVKVRQIRGDDDSRKKSGKEESAGVMRTDNEDTNLEKLPLKEDKCAIKINSNNLGENQSDCVSTAAKNINEGVKNSEHSFGDTKDLNGDKKNEGPASEDCEQVAKADQQQGYEETKEVSNHQQNGPSENHIQDEGNPKIDESSKNAADMDFKDKADEKDLTTNEDYKVQENKEDTTEAPNEDYKVQENEEDTTEAPNEDYKVQENEADIMEVPNEPINEEDITATSNENCKEQLKDLPAATEEEEIDDQKECGESLVDGNYNETKSTKDDELSGATQENITDQYMSEGENHKVHVNSNENKESEVQTQDSADNFNNDGENKDHELRTDNNSGAMELDIKTEETIVNGCDETASIRNQAEGTDPSSTNICEAKTNPVKITEVVSDPPQEANFLSIVDRIKTDITTLKTLSKSGTNASVNVNNEINEITKGAEKAISENDPKSSSQSNSEPVTSRNSDNQVKISKELSSHLINLSSANISEQLRKSCSNIVAMNQDFSKEFLLKKLEELLKQESKQVSEDLERRREQLRETQSSHSEVLRQMTERHKNELRTLNKQQTIKLDKMENLYLDEIEDTRKELELLENEQQNVKPQNQIINDCIRSLQPC